MEKQSHFQTHDIFAINQSIDYSCQPTILLSIIYYLVWSMDSMPTVGSSRIASSELLPTPHCHMLLTTEILKSTNAVSVYS